ncbi:MAG: GDSL-type esterase/lipase family protein [Firmicutes bacterium]|nr:GDSL-type esterase/lipase family protein [Bacillota bacterium]
MNKIICYGDSNTYGWDPSNLWGTPYRFPWPTVLANGLGVETVNMGEPGRCIPVSCGMDNLNALLEKHAPVDLVIVMLGTNDILNAMGAGISRIVDRMDQLLVNLSGQNVLLIEIPPATTGNGMIDEAVPRVNEEFKKLAQLRNVRFLSLEGVNIPLAFDGIHLTEVAHANLANHIISAIKE